MEDQPLVSFENTDIVQLDNVKVLEDVNLSISKGEFVYLIGKVGSGKSSLIKTLYAELPVQTGKVEFCGYNLSAVRKREIPHLRRKAGIVFQDFQLLPDRSVYGNLKFVLKATGWRSSDIDTRINEVLELVGLNDKRSKMPHELSGGEQQRVVIARAMLNHPEVILADEPTGNLDPETSESIAKLLRDISDRGCTVLMATHNYNLLKKFPARTLKCENGKVTDILHSETIIDFESLKED